MLITKNNGANTYLRVTYDSLKEYISMDIPYIIYKDTNRGEVLEVNPYKSVITVGQGNRAYTVDMENHYTEFYYLIVKAVEEYKIMNII